MDLKVENSSEEQRVGLVTSQGKDQFSDGFSNRILEGNSVQDSSLLSLMTPSAEEIDTPDISQESNSSREQSFLSGDSESSSTFLWIIPLR